MQTKTREIKIKKGLFFKHTTINLIRSNFRLEFCKKKFFFCLILKPKRKMKINFITQKY